MSRARRDAATGRRKAREQWLAATTAARRRRARGCGWRCAAGSVLRRRSRARALRAASSRALFAAVGTARRCGRRGARDERRLGLTLPLHGVQLIEASAGTGKTFSWPRCTRALVIERRPAGRRAARGHLHRGGDAGTARALRERLALAQRLLERRRRRRAPTQTPTPRCCGAAARGARRRAKREPRTARAPARAPPNDGPRADPHHPRVLPARAGRPRARGRPAAGAAELVANEAALRARSGRGVLARACARTRRDARRCSALWKSPAALADALRDLLPLDALLPAPVAVADGARAARDAALAARCARAFARMATTRAAALRARHRPTALSKHHVQRGRRRRSGVAALARAARRDRSTRGTTKLGDVYGAPRWRTAPASDKRRRRAPPSPLFDAIDAWLAARAARRAGRAAPHRRCVHAARDSRARAWRAQARARPDRLRRHDRAASPTRSTAAQRRRAGAAPARAVPRGAGRRVPGHRPAPVGDLPPPVRAARTTAAPRALFLIGDPKQAIYRFRGGDVFTYLAARANAGDAATRCDRNFRSRPRALRGGRRRCSTLRGDRRVRAAGHRFRAGRARRRVQRRRAAHRRRRRAGAGGLQVLAPRDEERDARAGARSGRPAPAWRRSRACSPPPRGRARCATATARAPARARRHRRAGASQREAQRCSDALAARRHPQRRGRAATACTTPTRPRDLLALLDALPRPPTTRRLRAALATPLFGLDAAALAALDVDGGAHRAWQDRAAALARSAGTARPAGAARRRCARAQAPRLLRAGRRRAPPHQLLQLAEDLQAPTRPRTGRGAAGRLLERRIADADAQRRRTAAPGIRRRARADPHAARQQGPEPSTRVPAVRRHRHGDGRTRAPLRTHARRRRRVALAHLLPGDDAAWDDAVPRGRARSAPNRCACSTSA